MQQDAAEGLLGMGWPIKSSFVRYVASSGGSRTVEPGAEFSREWGAVFAWAEHDVSRHTGDGTLGFQGGVEFSAHLGLLRVRVARPTLTLSGGAGTLAIEDADRTMRLLADVRYVYRCDDVAATWDFHEVTLADEAAALFGDVYAAGEPFDLITARMLVSQFSAKEGR